jgi:hypothetical protein
LVEERAHPDGAIISLEASTQVTELRAQKIWARDRGDKEMFGGTEARGYGRPRIPAFQLPATRTR